MQRRVLPFAVGVLLLLTLNSYAIGIDSLYIKKIDSLAELHATHIVEQIVANYSAMQRGEEDKLRFFIPEQVESEDDTAFFSVGMNGSRSWYRENCYIKSIENELKEQNKAAWDTLSGIFDEASGRIKWESGIREVSETATSYSFNLPPLKYMVAVHGLFKTFLSKPMGSHLFPYDGLDYNTQFSNLSFNKDVPWLSDDRVEWAEDILSMERAWERIANDYAMKVKEKVSSKIRAKIANLSELSERILFTNTKIILILESYYLEGSLEDGNQTVNYDIYLSDFYAEIPGYEGAAGSVMVSDSYHGMLISSMQLEMLCNMADVPADEEWNNCDYNYISEDERREIYLLLWDYIKKSKEDKNTITIQAFYRNYKYEYVPITEYPDKDLLEVPLGYLWWEAWFCKNGFSSLGFPTELSRHFLDLSADRQSLLRDWGFIINLMSLGEYQIKREKLYSEIQKASEARDKPSHLLNRVSNFAALLRAMSKEKVEKMNYNGPFGYMNFDFFKQKVFEYHDLLDACLNGYEEWERFYDGAFDGWFESMSDDDVRAIKNSKDAFFSEVLDELDIDSSLYAIINERYISFLDMLRGGLYNVIDDLPWKSEGLRDLNEFFLKRETIQVTESGTFYSHTSSYDAPVATEKLVEVYSRTMPSDIVKRIWNASSSEQLFNNALVSWSKEVSLVTPPNQEVVDAFGKEAAAILDYLKVWYDLGEVLPHQSFFTSIRAYSKLSLKDRLHLLVVLEERQEDFDEDWNDAKNNLLASLPARGWFSFGNTRQAERAVEYQREYLGAFSAYIEEAAEGKAIIYTVPLGIPDREEIMMLINREFEAAKALKDEIRRVLIVEDPGKPHGFTIVRDEIFVSEGILDMLFNNKLVAFLTDGPTALYPGCEEQGWNSDIPVIFTLGVAHGALTEAIGDFVSFEAKNPKGTIDKFKILFKADTWSNLSFKKNFKDAYKKLITDVRRLREEELSAKKVISMISDALSEVAKEGQKELLGKIALGYDGENVNLIKSIGELKKLTDPNGQYFGFNYINYDYYAATLASHPIELVGLKENTLSEFGNELSPCKLMASLGGLLGTSMVSIIKKGGIFGLGEAITGWLAGYLGNFIEYGINNLGHSYQIFSERRSLSENTLNILNYPLHIDYRYDNGSDIFTISIGVNNKYKVKLERKEPFKWNSRAVNGLQAHDVSKNTFLINLQNPITGVALKTVKIDIGGDISKLFLPEDAPAEINNLDNLYVDAGPSDSNKGPSYVFIPLTSENKGNKNRVDYVIIGAKSVLSDNGAVHIYPVVIFLDDAILTINE
ncbi:MAG: hypothetical protein KatS3mg033_0485 [Thermonema sp.]|uniref:hypothetical protein n=1 Tax=Thermonema sp. TaxID=2231181 RepID=UPI0021DDDBAB|nr:hypothetical protein [Thermonema sp.]GIV38685.1 MAG: hypothetical protein KatS3mg033_0485 [Thermonema sp.]